MSPIKKILKYFFHHSFSGEMVDRVHQRLAEPGDEREKEEVLREIWNEIGFPEADKRSEMAFTRLENTLDVRPRPCLRIPAWVRIAAIWLIPLLSLGVSYYLYRDARDVRQLAFMERFVPSGKRKRESTLPDLIQYRHDQLIIRDIIMDKLLRRFRIFTQRLPYLYRIRHMYESTRGVHRRIPKSV